MPAHKRIGRGRRAPDKRPRMPGVAAESTGPGAAPLVSFGVASLLIICFLLQCLAGMTQQSATYDEPVYIAAGYSYIETGDFRLKQDAPPLVATLSGVALRAGTYLGNEILFE